MNESDPLEAELAALAPIEPSAQLRERIAGELVTHRPKDAQWRRRQRWWNGAIACGLVAASLLLGILLLRRAQQDKQVEVPQSTSPITAAVFDATLPTVWNYERALARSPQDFDMLLDKHAAAGSSRAAAAPRHLFIQSDAALLYQGEL
jgi:hypothetical protein